MDSGAITHNGINGESVLLPVVKDLKREHAREHVTNHNQRMVVKTAQEKLWTLGKFHAKHLYVQVSKHVQTQGQIIHNSATNAICIETLLQSLVWCMAI